MAESTTLTPNTDSLQIRGSADNVVLPSGLVGDLMPLQVAKMKETVFIVRNNSRIAGQLIRSTAFTLYEMKKNLRKNSQWIAFLKSGALPIPERQARDMVAAWEGWMSDSDVTDGDLVGLGVRTLAKMKSLSPSDRKKLISKNKKGEKITEKDVVTMSEGKVKGQDDNGEWVDALGVPLKNFTRKEIETKFVAANNKIKELENEIEFLKAGK